MNHLWIKTSYGERIVPGALASFWYHSYSFSIRGNVQGEGTVLAAGFDLDEYKNGVVRRALDSLSRLLMSDEGDPRTEWIVFNEQTKVFEIVPTGLEPIWKTKPTTAPDPALR